jgi:hypothetical protein
MKTLSPHPWKVTPQQALKIQNELVHQVEQKNRLRTPQWIDLPLIVVPHVKLDFLPWV